jgi:hypothetical protein
MNIEVIPIAITQVDLPQYRKILRPEARLDPYFIDPDSLLGYISSMVKDGDPRNAVRNINYILRHVSVSFYIKCDERDIQELKFFGNLTVTWLQEELFLMTGRLDEWKSVLIDLCNQTSTMKTRYILNSCLLYIEKAGLMEVFGNFSKKVLADQTFILQRKE